MENKKIPILWASAARLIACSFIFMYHFLVLHQRESYGLGTYGLYIFFFLAGWFAVLGHKDPFDWLKGRLRRILVPYWPVIFVVLVANRVVGYKETTLLKDVMVFLGLSLFVDNPVYVISWFITMIVMLDVSYFIFRMIRCKYWRIVYLVAVYVFFDQVTPMLIRPVMLFYLGAAVSYLSKNWDGIGPKLYERFAWYRTINQKLFILQNYTYSFFLVHGAVLILMIKALKIYNLAAFVLALALSIVVAYGHNRLLKKYA